MKNKEVISNFLVGRSARAGTLHTDGKTLYSYDTAIAHRDGRRLTINSTKYSVTTSKQQQELRRQARNYEMHIEEDAGNYPRGYRFSENPLHKHIGEDR